MRSHYSKANGWRALKVLGLGTLLAIFGLGQTSLSAERPLGKLFADAQSDDGLSRSRAHAEIRNRGVDALGPLSELLVNEPGRHTVLQSLFTENLALFLEEIDEEVLALTEDRLELAEVEKEIAIEEKNDANLEARRERLKSLKKRVDQNAPKVQEQTSFLRKIATPGLGEILRRLELVDPILVRYYGALLEDLV